MEAIRSRRGLFVSKFEVCTITLILFALTIGCAGASGSTTSNTLKVTTTTLPSAQVGTAYSATLAATGGTAPYTWSVPSGSWPAGIGLSYFGIFSGTPTYSGQYTFTVQVKDSASRTATASLTINVAAAGSTPTSSTSSATPLSITTSSLPNGQVGTAYSASLSATGGTAPYTFSVPSGSWPGGVGLSYSGVFSGSPTTAGQYTFEVQAKDSSSTPQVATKSLTITVTSASAATTTTSPTIATTSLPTAYANQSYTTTLTGSGGTAPYQWVLASGQLPTGFSLSSAGVISGTTTVTGTFPITVQLTDSNGKTATASFSLIVTTQTSTTAYTRWYETSSFWNTPIPANPTIDPNSAAMVATAITPYASSAIFTNDDAWGIPVAYATSSSETYNIACTLYCTTNTVSFQIPAGALVDTGTDHHLSVINGTQELDMWEASYDATNDTWSAEVVVTTDLMGWGAICAEGQQCNGAVAAGFAALGGLVRPQEIAAGQINHALAFFTPYTREDYIACPATHTDGAYNSTSALPEGAHIQLNPSFNVAAQNWPAWEKTIAVALQTYGAYVVDTAGAIGVRGVTDQNAGDATWASANTPEGPLISDIPWSQIQVLQLQSCGN